MEDELVIFEDLPSKATPLNAYNLNHNFEVFKKQTDKATQDVANTLQDIETSKSQMEADIKSKVQELEKNITDKTTEFTNDINSKVETLESNITEKTNTLESSITSKTEKLESDFTEKSQQLQESIDSQVSNLNEDITTKTSDLENSITEKTQELNDNITSATKDLETKIAEALSKITTIKKEIVTSLPTENIDDSTIYFIKASDLPQSSNVQTRSLQSAKTPVSLYDMKGNSIQSIEITEEDYYLACFYVVDKWIVIGSAKMDLSNIVKKEELEEKVQELTQSIDTKIANLKSEIEGKNYLTEESDPTVPSHVKGITAQDITNWNGKATQEDIDSAISKAITQALEASY